MNRIFSAVLFLALMLPVYAADSPPDQIARDATDKIIGLLKSNKDAYSKDHQKLYAMVDEHVLPHFDFRAMSRTVLGRYWRSASEDQRTQFISEFRKWQTPSVSLKKSARLVTDLVYVSRTQRET